MIIEDNFVIKLFFAQKFKIQYWIF